MKRLNFAITGCGRISKKHIEAIGKIPGAQLYAVCDSNIEKADGAVDSAYVKRFRDFEDLIADKEIDVVNICTPSGLHTDMAIRAMECGKNVILEKPMAMDIASAERIITAKRSTGKALTVILQNRFNPPIAFIKKHQDNLGRLLTISASVYWYRSQDYYEDGWHGTKKMDGGALLNQGTHYIDMISYFMNDSPTEILAAGATLRHSMECEDAAALILKFRDGRFCTLQANTISYPENFEGSIILFFEKATVKIAGKALDRIEYWKGALQDEAERFNAQPISDIYGNGHQTQIGNMASHLLNGTKLLVEAEDGLASLRIIESAYKQIHR
jgi:predicted dehydrogenase